MSNESKAKFCLTASEFTRFGELVAKAHVATLAEDDFGLVFFDIDTESQVASITVFDYDENNFPGRCHLFEGKRYDDKPLARYTIDGLFAREDLAPVVRTELKCDEGCEGCKNG